MRLIFIRHGYPDYQRDCLTELGHRQAQAAAKRLASEHIDRICSSTCGRAIETAKHIAESRELTVETYPFMSEICWGSINEEPIYKNGHPWYTVGNMVAMGQPVMDMDWDKKLPFSKNIIVEQAKRTAEGFDQWLKQLGYERCGAYYRVEHENTDTILMASHAGSSSAVIAHLLNLPLPFVCAVLAPDLTAITVLSFRGIDGSLTCPMVEIMNDARHLSDSHS